MVWIFGIICLIIFIIILINFPKQTLIVFFSLILLIVFLWYKYITVPDQYRKSITDKVSVTVLYNVATCNYYSPLFITIINNSNKTITKVSWDVNTYVPGYSTDISGWPNNYSSDKILKPGESWSSCYTLPSNLNNKNHDPGSLKYGISNKYVQFQD